MWIEQSSAKVKQRPYTAGDITTCQRLFKIPLWHGALAILAQSRERIVFQSIMPLLFELHKKVGIFCKARHCSDRIRRFGPRAGTDIYVAVLVSRMTIPAGQIKYVRHASYFNTHLDIQKRKKRNQLYIIHQRSRDLLQ